MVNELINIMERGLLIDYEEFTQLKEAEQENFFTCDDFIDCDCIKIKGKLVVNFIGVNDNIYYIIMPEYEDHEDYIKHILSRFYADNFKESFKEIDTWLITASDKTQYKKIIENNIVVYYRGGCGYSYGVHKFQRRTLYESAEFLNLGEV